MFNSESYLISHGDYCKNASKYIFQKKKKCSNEKKYHNSASILTSHPSRTYGS